MKYLLPLLLIVIACSKPTAPSSGKLASGHIKMSITDVTSSIPGSNMNELVKDMSHEIYFAPGKQLTIVKSGAGAATQTYFLDDQVLQYLDVNNQKVLVKMNLKEWQNHNQSSSAAKTNVTYHPEIRKEILGYDCYQAVVEMVLPKMEGLSQAPKMKVELFLTDDISLSQSALQQLKGLELSGTPLEIKMDMGIMSMTYQATTIDDVLPANAFDKPVGNYPEATIDYLASVNKGMLGM